MNPSVPEFIPGTVWHGHSKKFSIPSPIVEPGADRIWEPKMQTEDANSTSAPNVARDIDTVDCRGVKERKEKLNRSGKFWTEMTSNELMAVSKRVMRQTAKCTR
ncbi:hypothetical protein COLO4_04365 [Corchorus olitorius]|uniref:Uncharacterized protein n=1 Tax=Corchorus olitorius TaxID=93759 RepID=A0A1R3KU95_9ROSI|nr:hypothetical protein COLO4_04365 [Corchorus olitorius]